MIKHNDFSEEATRSGITLSKAVSMSGYNNIIFAEVYTRGYYEGEELMENFKEFPDTKKILFGSDYQDIGVGVVLGVVEGKGLLLPNFFKMGGLSCMSEF